MKKMDLSSSAAGEQAIRVGKIEDVIVFENGHPVALIIDDDDLEWYARERDPEFIKSIALARAKVKAGEFLTEAELKKELGME